MIPIAVLTLGLAVPPVTEGDFVLRDFRFRSGETLPELRLHYATMGRPQKDAGGVVRNAVLVLHGTGGSSRQFLIPAFAGELFDAGQLLDAARYFIVIPDGSGTGAPASPATACACASRATRTTTWWRRSTGYSPRAWVSTTSSS